MILRLLTRAANDGVCPQSHHHTFCSHVTLHQTREEKSTLLTPKSLLPQLCLSNEMQMFAQADWLLSTIQDFGDFSLAMQCYYNFLTGLFTLLLSLITYFTLSFLSTSSLRFSLFFSANSDLWFLLRPKVNSTSTKLLKTEPSNFWLQRMTNLMYIRKTHSLSSSGCPLSDCEHYSTKPHLSS